MTRKEHEQKTMSQVAAILAARICGSVEKEKEIRNQAIMSFEEIYGQDMPPNFTKGKMGLS